MSVKKIPTGPYHPGYGCAIFIIIFLTFGGIITWSVYTLLKQNKEISTFTTENAPPLVPLTISESDKASLLAKLQAFAAATIKNETADLSLSVAELNAMLVLAADAKIGGDEGSAPYADMFRFTQLDSAAKHILADTRMPMNKLPWEQGKRFLVGAAAFELAIENHSLDLKLDSIQVPGKTVNEGFLAVYRTMPWLSVAKTKPEIATALER